MGKRLQNKAEQFGLTTLPKYTFFGRPNKMKMKFSKYKPDFAYEVERWITTEDPSTMMDESGGGRNNTFYYLAPQIRVYVVITDKMAGAVVHNPGNHTIQLDIYTNNEEYVRTIVSRINGIWDDGIVPHLDLKKLEKKYKIRSEDIVNAWNTFLS